MNHAFDPYHQWLGISPKDQPPNHYRLLGIDLFESDLDVITNAAFQRMAHVRTFQLGVHSAISQTLLNELAAAKVCLLDPEKKAAYDAHLRQEIAPPLASPPANQEQEFPWMDAGRPAGAIVPAGRPSSAHGGKSARWPAWQFAAMAGVGMIAIMGLVIMVSGRRPSPEKRDRPSRPDDQPVAQSQENVDAGKNEDQPPTGPAVNRVATDLTPANPSPNPTRDSTERAQPEPPRKPAEDPPGPKAPIAATQPPKPKVAPPKISADAPAFKPSQPKTPSAPKAADHPVRLPVPAESTRQEAMKVVQELYRDRNATAKTPAEKQTLAKRLLEQARKTSGDEAGQFVLLSMASETAAKAADATTAMDAVDDLAKSYEVDGLDLKLSLLGKCAKQSHTPAEQKSIAEHGRALAAQALAEDNAEAALRAGELMLAAARKTRDAVLVKASSAAQARIKQVAAAAAEALKAKDALRENPDSPEANLALGRYLTAVKADWDQGLRCLAKGSDQELKELAQREIKAPDTSSEDQAKLADAWWDQASARKGMIQNAAYLRAAHWYQKARAKVESELIRARIDKRLDEIEEIRPLGEIPPLQSSLADGSAAPSSSEGIARRPGKIIPEMIDKEVRLPRVGSPYKLMSRVTVALQGKLLIERGSLVLTAPGSAILAQGVLNSCGDSEEFVKFRPAVPQAGWDKIELQVGVKHIVERFDIRGASQGLSLASETNTPAEMEMEVRDCVILGNKVGVETKWTHRPAYRFRNCIIANNQTDGIRVRGRNPILLDHCTMANNGVGLNLSYYGNVTIKSCLITGNGMGIAANRYDDTNLTMNGSNIFGNRTGAMDILSERELQCRGNHWGTSNPEQIAAMINDGRKRPGKGVVHFDDFAAKPISDAGSSLRIPKRE